MASIKELAKMSDNVYDGQMPLPSGWELNGEVVKISYGFQAAVYQNSQGEKVVAFCGSNDKQDFTVEDRLILLRKIPPQSISAMMFFEMAYSSTGFISKNKFLEFANEIKNSFKGDCFNREPKKEISGFMVTGHSLGGSLATIVANKYGVKAVVFNSMRGMYLTNKNVELHEYSDKILKIVNLESTIRREVGKDFSIENEEGFDDDYIKGIIEKRLRNKLDPDENHLLDVMRIYRQETVDTRASKLGNDLVTNYFIYGDIAVREVGYFGKWYCAQRVGSLFNVHDIAQWSDVDERYDEKGDFDPEKEVNLTKAQRALKQQNEGIDWSFI